MPEKLTLVALDAEDLQTISAVLQDALIQVGDMQYFADQKRFAILANRFRWEREAGRSSAAAPSASVDQRFDTAAAHERVHCGVAFDGVRAIKMRGIDRDKRSRLLNLLLVQAIDGGILLVFSDNAAIQLDCDGVACQVRDLAEAWPTPWRPSHETSDKP